MDDLRMTVDKWEYDQALRLMSSALKHLDSLGLHVSANYLDHAIALVEQTLATRLHSKEITELASATSDAE